MESDFQLTNNGAPSFEKPDPEAFLPMSHAQKVRHAIYSHLQSTKLPVKLSELMKISQASRQEVKNAALSLARKGLIKRTPIKEPRPTMKDPAKTIKSVELEFIEPWTEKLKQVNT